MSDLPPPARPGRKHVFRDRPFFAMGYEGYCRTCPAKPVRAKQDGGVRRDRTDDLMLAKHALYQLSYGPIGADPGECLVVDP